MNTVCQTLGEHLRATRVGIRETDPLAGRLPVRAEWTADGVATAGASLSWADLGSVAARLDAGHAVRVARTGDLEDPAARTFLGLGAAAVLAIPWGGSGELRAVLFVHRAEAHDWSDEEVAVVEQVFERTIHALDRERSEAREKTMLREIDHRARNMLAISQALIRLVKADDVETLRTSLLARMGALGNTLSILSAEQWEGASLEVLLKAELAPYLSDEIPSVTLRGPEVIVAPDKARPMAMAIHELAANALKHGALSSPSGTLRVTWEILRDGNLSIDWSERNGEPATGVQRPGSGFGTKLLGMTIESQLGG